MPVNPEVLGALIQKYGVDRIRSAKDSIASRREQKMFDSVSGKIASQRLPGEVTDEPIAPLEQEIMSYTDAGDPIQMLEAGQMIANGQVLPGVAMMGLTLAPQALTKGISKAIEKKVAENAAKKKVSGLKKYAKENGLGVGKDVDTGETLLMTWQGPMYLKDGKLEPVEGVSTAGSAAKTTYPVKSGYDQAEWENWLAGHEGYFSKAGGLPDSPATAFNYIPEYEADHLAEIMADARATPQEYWKAMADLNAAHQADPYLKYKNIDKSAYTNLTDSNIDAIIDEAVLNGWTPEQTVKNLQFANAKGAPVGGSANVSSTTSATQAVPRSNSTQLVGITPMVYNQPLVSASTIAPNEGKVMRTIPHNIMVSTPEHIQVQQILDMVNRGEMEPLETMARDISGDLVAIPDWWAAALRTDAAKKAYPEGVDYFWRGFTAVPGWQSGLRGYDSFFGGSHDLAAGYKSGFNYTASLKTPSAYSTEGGIPNMYLLTIPKGKLREIDTVRGQNWSELFEPTPENISLMQKYYGNVPGVSGDYSKMIFSNPLILDGYKIHSTDDISRLLGKPVSHTPGMEYPGVVLRGIHDGGVGDEVIWNPKRGGFPKIVHPGSSFKFALKDPTFLKNGGSIRIKPSKRGTFTAAATKHGKSVQAFASQVLSHPENYSSAMVKKANFARNAAKWHTDGGFLKEYPDGGRLRGKQNGKFFVTELSPRKEKKFQDWYAGIAPILGLDANPDAYEHAYDYRGYWLNNRDADVSSPDFHFPDTWKQPHHPTFSNESIYAEGREGVGHWDGERFIPGLFNNVMQATEPMYLQEAPAVVKSNYTPSDSILNYIKDTEAYRGDWYQDGNGVWTVGYGFTGDDVRKRYPNGMTKDEADRYFADTVSRRIPQFIQATPNFDKLNQNQKDALFSYYYNIGHGGYTRKSPTMQQALRDMDLDTVVRNIDFGYNDNKNRGLRKRRDYERKLFGTPLDYGGYIDRLRRVFGDDESVRAAILRAKNIKKTT